MQVCHFVATWFLLCMKTGNQGCSLDIIITSFSQIDVYSYGVLLCEMSTCELPIREERASQINGISNANLKKLARACTSTDPATRPTMQKIIGIMSTIDM